MKKSKHNRNVKSLYENIFPIKKQVSPQLSPKVSLSRNSIIESQLVYNYYSTHLSSPFYSSTNFTPSNSLNKMVASITKIDQTILPNLTRLSSTYRSDFFSRIQPRDNYSSNNSNTSKQPLLQKTTFLENKKQELKQHIQQSKLPVNSEKFKLVSEPSNAQNKLQKFIKKVTLNNEKDSLVIMKPIDEEKKEIIQFVTEKLNECNQSQSCEQKLKPETPKEKEKQKQFNPEKQFEINTLGSSIQEIKETEPQQSLKEVTQRFFPKINQSKQSQVSSIRKIDFNQNSIFSIVLSQEFQRLREDQGRVFVRLTDLIVCDSLKNAQRKQKKKKKRQLTSKSKYFLTNINKASNENVQLKEKAFLRKINQIFNSHYVQTIKNNNIEEINLDTSILSDGEKEIKYLQQQSIKPQFRMTLLNQISLIPQKQQSEMNQIHFKNEYPLNMLIEALDEEKPKSIQILQQNKKPVEKKVTFKTKKKISIHLWTPGNDKITTTFNIPDYYQFIPDQKQDNQQQIKWISQGNEPFQEEIEIENEYLNKPKNVFKQAIQSLISNSKNRVKKSSSILKIAGIQDDLKSDPNIEDFQSQQKFYEQKIFAFQVIRYAKLYLQYKLKKIFERNESHCLVLLQFLTDKKPLHMILNNIQEVQKIQSCTTLLNYTKYETGLVIKIQSNEILKIPPTTLQFIKLDGLTPILKKMYLADKLESESPKPKAINDSISPKRKNDSIIVQQHTSVHSSHANTLLSIQHQDEEDDDSLTGSSLIQSQRQIELESKAQMHFINDLQNFYQTQKEILFIEMGQKYSTILVGDRIRQPGWRTNTIQLIVSTLDDQTRNSMLSQQMTTQIDKEILRRSINDNNQEIKFRDVNSYLNKLDGKCRQIQLFNIYEQFQELLTGEFEDNLELNYLSQEIEFIEEEEQLIDEKVCSQISISYRPSQTLNIQYQPRKDETQSSIVVDPKFNQLEKSSPSKARINRLRTVFKGYNHITHPKPSQQQQHPIVNSTNQNTSTNTTANQNNNTKLSPHPQKREVVAIRTILKKSTLMDSLLPNSSDVLRRRSDSPNECQVSNEEISSQKVLAKSEDTNTNESQEKMKQEKQNTVHQQQSSQNQIKIENQKKENTYLSSQANRNFEKNQSMTKYSFKMRTLIQESNRRKTKNLSEQIWLYIIESKFVEVRQLLDELIQLIELLGQHPNLQINERINDGSTYLIIACQIGCQEIVEYLISRGANINLQDNNGNTALHTALAFNNLKVADYLFNCGALQNIRNSEGLTPWQMIMRQ